MIVFLYTELTYRFETAPFGYQRNILKYMLPWLCNVQLVDIASSRPMLNVRDAHEEEITSNGNTDSENLLPHVEMTGDGWGSSKATQLVLNNLFFLTVKVGGSLHLIICCTVFDVTCTLFNKYLILLIQKNFFIEQVCKRCLYEFWTPLAWYRPIKWKGWYTGWNTKKQHLFHQHFCIVHATKNIKLCKSNWGMLHVVKTFLHFFVFFI